MMPVVAGSAGVWTRRRVVTTIGFGFVRFVFSLPILALLLGWLANKAVPRNDMGISAFIVLLGMFILIPILWLSLIIWTGSILRQHGGPRVCAKLPIIHAGLWLAGALPILYVVSVMVIVIQAPRSAPVALLARTYLMAMIPVFAGGLGLAAIAYWKRGRTQKTNP